MGDDVEPRTYGESTAPVMSALACKLLLAMAATLGMKIASIDIATAFCLTPNPYEVYLELPDALEKRFGKYVRMLKCVYGTRQAVHQFYMMMRGGLERASLSGVGRLLRIRGYYAGLYSACPDLFAEQSWLSVGWRLGTSIAYAPVFEGNPRT